MKIKVYVYIMKNINNFNWQNKTDKESIRIVSDRLLRRREQKRIDEILKIILPVPENIIYWWNAISESNKRDVIENYYFIIHSYSVNSNNRTMLLSERRKCYWDNILELCYEKADESLLRKNKIELFFKDIYED